MNLIDGSTGVFKPNLRLPVYYVRGIHLSSRCPMLGYSLPYIFFGSKAFIFKCTWITKSHYPQWSTSKNVFWI